MPNLFGIDIAGIVRDAIGPGLPALTLVKVSKGARPVDPTIGLVSTETRYPGKGIVDTYSDGLVDGTRVKLGDRRVLLIAKSLPLGIFPVPDDLIEAEGDTWTIVQVSRDPAEATYDCQVRERS